MAIPGRAEADRLIYPAPASAIADRPVRDESSYNCYAMFAC